MLSALLYLVGTVLFVLRLLVIVRVVASWLDANPNNGIIQAIHQITEPLYKAVRPLARKIPGPFDWSPALVLVGIEVVRRLLLS